jgi:hypothetical protein
MTLVSCLPQITAPAAQIADVQDMHGAHAVQLQIGGPPPSPAGILLILLDYQFEARLDYQSHAHYEHRKRHQIVNGRFCPAAGESCRGELDSTPTQRYLTCRRTLFQEIVRPDVFYARSTFAWYPCWLFSMLLLSWIAAT